MRKAILVASAFAISISLANTVIAEENTITPSPSNKISKELSLTPDQNMQIEKMREQARTILTNTRAQLQNINTEIKAISKESSIDDSKLSALIEKKKEVLGSIMKERALIMHQIYGILSPEQKVKFDDFMKKREINESMI